MKTQLRGQRAEQTACQYLNRNGLVLVTRNYHCRCGEIDLIMRDGESLVFVEVRYRRSNHFGSSAETVDFRKRKKLIHTAQHYLQTHPQEQKRPARFDVIAMEGSNQIEWIRCAFDA